MSPMLSTTNFALLIFKLLGRRCHRYSAGVPRTRIPKHDFYRKLCGITRRVPQWCVAAAKGFQNMSWEPKSSFVEGVIGIVQMFHTKKVPKSLISNKKISKIIGRIPKWSLGAAKGSNNIILEQKWCQEGAKRTKIYPKVDPDRPNRPKMVPKGDQHAPKREPNRPRDLKKEPWWKKNLDSVKKKLDKPTRLLKSY